MSDILNSMNSSPMPRGIPRQGATVTMATPDADIAALLEQITAGDPDALGDFETESYEEPDDPDVVDDLDKIVESMPAEISAPTPEVHTTNGASTSKAVSLDDSDTDDLVDSDDDDEEEDNESGEGKLDIKKYIIAGVVLIAVIVLAVILTKTFNGPTASQPEQTTSQPVVTSQSTFYADQLTASDANTYQDSMVIEKYIILDQDTCVFVFKGYAENARAFITAYVDIDTYNRYKTGARVPILYERISIDGNDYYMKVRVNA